MIDMLGRDIEVGQRVFYFTPRSGGMQTHQANVIKIRDQSIRIAFLGRKDGGKKDGQQSNIYNTEGKIFILGENALSAALIISQRDLYQGERNVLAGQIDELLRENKLLREDLGKIHNRFEILDL